MLRGVPYPRWSAGHAVGVAANVQPLGDAADNPLLALGQCLEAGVEQALIQLADLLVHHDSPGSGYFQHPTSAMPLGAR